MCYLGPLFIQGKLEAALSPLPTTGACLRSRLTPLFWAYAPRKAHAFVPGSCPTQGSCLHSGLMPHSRLMPSFRAHAPFKAHAFVPGLCLIPFCHASYYSSLQFAYLSRLPTRLLMHHPVLRHAPWTLPSSIVHVQSFLHTNLGSLFKGILVHFTLTILILLVHQVPAAIRA